MRYFPLAKIIFLIYEVWGKVIFSEACVKNSVHRGACMAGGHVWQGGIHGPGGHVWPGGVHAQGSMCGGWGVCVVGGMHVHGWGACMAGRHVWWGRGMPHMPPWPDTMRYSRSMSGQYASYWNVFLFVITVTIYHCRPNSLNNIIEQCHLVLPGESMVNKKKSKTRLHSSRMHTTRLLPISPSMHCSRGVPGSGGCLLWGCLLQGGCLVWGVCSQGISQHTMGRPPSEQNHRHV